jgi:hypothetical protein
LLGCESDFFQIFGNLGLAFRHASCLALCLPPHLRGERDLVEVGLVVAFAEKEGCGREGVE